MSSAPDPPRGAARSAPGQRVLELTLRAGGVLVVIGLATTVVIVALYLVDATTPGTWAYGLAMLAPLGFGLILLALLGVALVRRRAGLATGRGRDRSERG